jgi:hypothetical protein
MREIRRLVVNGVSYCDIWQRLEISKRTFYRYLRVVFDYDERVMNERIGEDEFMRQMVILRDRLNKMYQECEAIATDSTVNGQARVNALNLAGEVAISIVKIHREVPAKLAAYDELPLHSAANAPQQSYQNGKRLRQQKQGLIDSSQDEVG